MLCLWGGWERKLYDLGMGLMGLFKLLSVAQLVLTSVGLFCACSSSWSGGQGDGIGLHAWDLL